MPVKTGYEKNYDYLVTLLLEADFTAAAALGFTETGADTARISFLRRDYQMTRHGVDDLGGAGKEHINCRGALIYYLTHGGAAAREEPAGEFQLLHQFSSGVFSGGGKDLNWMARSLTKIFGGPPAIGLAFFRQAMTILGAVEVTARANADASFLYALLPKLPVEIDYYAADDEFPCEVKFLFDRRALDFLPFETLAVAAGCLVGEIAHIATDMG
ncbi:MAG: DUF3786 domain-containing protein [Desulfobulbaceae bacterium]|jgi:hypothetical protein|nr:DUF3786 domain-containing protein [Desulfobulbaceae bacterium]